MNGPQCFPVPVGTREGDYVMMCELEIVGDMCNVCGSVAFSYMLMHLNGQLNITNIGNDSKEDFLYMI